MIHHLGLKLYCSHLGRAEAGAKSTKEEEGRLLVLSFWKLLIRSTGKSQKKVTKKEKEKGYCLNKRKKNYASESNRVNINENVNKAFNLTKTGQIEKESRVTRWKPL